MSVRPPRGGYRAKSLGKSAKFVRIKELGQNNSGSASEEAVIFVASHSYVTSCIINLLLISLFHEYFTLFRTRTNSERTIPDI